MFRIIIVEDEPPIIRSIKEKITNVDPDFKVVGEYHNGESALLEMDIVKPHVLITDLHMPVMNGTALLERVREEYPEVICVILSGYQNFEYTRMAIRKGITDYLLKPPTEETIFELLVVIKKKLMQNQSLIESEILQHLVFPNQHTNDNDAKTEKMAKEYFYHANYVMLYAWTSPELQTDLPVQSLLSKAAEWLKEGERYYLISSLANEFIVLFGVHDLHDKRYEECEALIRSLPDIDSITFVLLPIEGWISKIPGLLVKARKAALVNNYADQASMVIVKADDMVYDPGRIELPVDSLNHLISFMRKQKKTEFEKQFVSMLSACKLEAFPKVTVIRTLQHIVQMLEPNVQPPINSSTARSMEDEIEQAIWGTANSTEIIEHMKRIFGRLFQESETEETDWLTDVEEYLKKYYVSNISLTDLSEKFNLNASYLSYVFKSKKNKSPIDFLIELRVEEAKRLIREHPRLLFKDIAEQVGYPDPYYFSKLFKQMTGLTPTEYKRNQLEHLIE
ncbi:response regulator transcription factor [Cohnella silvisoli]|uniref:Response regulator n=1 Tax=Cohnella silvisoli TaxID=2873699 RepID=A0ABV1KX43_9BACL|nr:response regulator [Cohnella silvisoli]MCD9023756.1 response regulator [Cohnella silvisoli]